MTDNEMRLIRIIREHGQPTEALSVAIQIIVSYLMRQQSYPRPYFVDPRE